MQRIFGTYQMNMNVSDLKHCPNCGEPIEMVLQEGMVSFYQMATGKCCEAGAIVPRPCKCSIAAGLAEQERINRIHEKERQINALRKEIPALYKSACFENDNGCNPKLLEYAVQYAKNLDDIIPDTDTKKGLLLHGDVGVGKTYTAYCILDAVYKTSHTGCMIDLNRYIQSCEPNGDYLYRDKCLSRAKKLDLIIFDDYGADRNTDFCNEKLFELVDTRIRSNKPMIVTTNFSFSAMCQNDSSKKRINDRILGACIPIECTGKSNRLKTNPFGKAIQTIRSALNNKGNAPD